MSNASSKPKKPKLSPEIEAQLKEAFAVFDVSGDGQIDAVELQMILTAVNSEAPSLEDVEQMINEVDMDGGGEIGLEEFLVLMANKMQQAENDEELITAFKLFGAKDAEDVISLEKLTE